MPTLHAPFQQQVAPYGWVRRRLRAAYFSLLRKTLALDDGRDILFDSSKGISVRSPRPDADLLREQVYEGLGGPTSVRARRAILVTARFRSGSTLLWNLFRHVPDCTAFYEPLNERRWFDPRQRGTRVDTTHRGVDDYWREYEGLTRLDAVFREEWTHRNLYMDEGFVDASLTAYLDALIAHAPSRAVLQFNRADFRLPWLRRHYPDSLLVHLYRHPREQWLSSLGNPSDVPRDVTTVDFEPHDHYYLLPWARDLKHVFPLLDPARETHPYRLFYLLWKLSYVFGRMYADHSVAYEDLTRSPHKTIARLLRVCDLDERFAPDLCGLVQPSPATRWRSYASSDWFEQHESACETILAREFGEGVPAPSVTDSRELVGCGPEQAQRGLR